MAVNMRWAYLVTQLIFAIIFSITTIASLLIFVKHRLGQRIKYINGIQMLMLSLSLFSFSQVTRLGLAEFVMTLLDSLDPFINITTRNCLNILTTSFLIASIAIILFIWVKNFFIQFKSFEKVLSTLFSAHLLVVMITACICLIIYSVGMVILQDATYSPFHYAFIGGYGSLIFVYMLFATSTLTAFTYLIYQELEGVNKNIVDNGRLLNDQDDDQIFLEEERHFVKKTNKSLVFLLVSGGMCVFFILVGLVYLMPSLGHIIIAASKSTYEWYDYVVSLVRLLILAMFTVYCLVVFFKEDWTSPEMHEKTNL